MRMLIKDVKDVGECIYVTGITSVGIVKGIWHYREKPVMNDEYFFELSIDEIDRSEISIVCQESFCPEVYLSDERVFFRGICEEIDDIYVIRFSIDWIELIAVENDDFSIKRGDCISFSISCDCIGIYPY